MQNLSFFKAETIPVHSVLADMEINISVNGEGYVLIVHEKEFSPPLERIDYDAHRSELIFIDSDGHSRDFGMPVPPKTRRKMDKAKNANFLHVGDGNEVLGINIVPIRHIESGG